MAKKIKIKVNEEEFAKCYNNVLDCKQFEEFISDKSKSRKNAITLHVSLYCYHNHFSIGDMISEKDGESIKNRLDEFDKFLEDEKYTPTTIATHRKNIKSFYNYLGTEIPKKKAPIHEGYLADIKQSESFNYFLKVKTLSQKTIEKYQSDLSSYCFFHDMKIDDLIEEADIEEEQGIRKNKRKIKTRIIDFRKYLRANGYAEKTIKSRISNVKTFYSYNNIDLPTIPKDTKQYDRELRIDEIPTKEHIKRALETTTSLRNRAMFMFMCASGSDSATMRTFTVREWMLGTKGFHGETEDIQKALEKMDGEMEYIPVFPIVREKKRKDYYTCITPEANQFIVNWLKTRDGLELDDLVFDISEEGVYNAFGTVNDLNNWGKVKDGRHRFWCSHQCRRYNFNVFGIENMAFAHMIEGRKFTATEEAYFARDPKEIREIYLEYLDDLTIYDKYQINVISDEGYAELKEENEVLVSEMEELKQQNAELKNQVKAQGIEMNNIKKDIDNYIQKYVALYNAGKTVMTESYKQQQNVIIPMQLKNYIDGCLNKTGHLTDLEKKIQSLTQKEIKALIKISYDIAIKYEDLEEPLAIKVIVQKAITKMTLNPELVENTITYLEEKSMNHEKLQRYLEILHHELDSIGVYEQDEIQRLCDKLSNMFTANIDTILMDDITQELIRRDIEKIL